MVASGARPPAIGLNLDDVHEAGAPIPVEAAIRRVDADVGGQAVWARLRAAGSAPVDVQLGWDNQRGVFTGEFPGKLDAIGAIGAVVSEYPPGTTPARHRFLVRNRIIAALGAETVVVEAGRRSGTLSTAAADQLGRVVMAVPGPVTSAMSVGCHLLLADRFAQLVTGPTDVLAALGRAPDEDRQPPLPGTDPRHPTDGLDADTARVYEALPSRGTVMAADVIAESGLLGPRVLAALAVLELHGLAGRDGPRWRRVVPRR